MKNKVSESFSLKKFTKIDYLGEIILSSHQVSTSKSFKGPLEIVECATEI